MPSNDGARGQVGLSDAERRDLKEGLIATVVGAGVDSETRGELVEGFLQVGLSGRQCILRRQGGDAVENC